MILKYNFISFLKIFVISEFYNFLCVIVLIKKPIELFLELLKKRTR